MAKSPARWSDASYFVQSRQMVSILLPSVGGMRSFYMTHFIRSPDSQYPVQLRDLLTRTDVAQKLLVAS